MNEEIPSSQIPQAVEAEQSVIGSMLIDARCVPDVVGILKPDDFFAKHNEEIYSAILWMFQAGKVIDPVTVIETVKERSGHTSGEIINYIKQLMEVTPTAANAKQYASIVRDKATLRNLLEAADDIANQIRSGEGHTEEILETAEKRIYGVRKSNTSKSLEHIKYSCVRVFDHLIELRDAKDKIPGLRSGFIDLDKKINGLNKSDFMLIAARPGMGKTALALNITLNVAKKYDKIVAFFSLEMSRDQLTTRLISNQSLVDNAKLMTATLNNDDWVKVGDASAVLSSREIYIDDNPSITVSEMSATCRRLDNLGLVVIDYLQLMTSSGGKPHAAQENRVQIVGDISRSLKIMAKELNVPVICLSQLSRAVEQRGDKHPMLSDLRESGSIEQDADEVLFIYRDDYYNEKSDKKNVAECIIAKNRHGETGTVELQWLPQYTTFANKEYRYEQV